MDELKAPGKPFDISKRAVWEAWEKVKANKGAPGVDGVTVAEFESDLRNNLDKIWNRLSSGACFPPPVRAVQIPKPHGGGTRILGVPFCRGSGGADGGGGGDRGEGPSRSSTPSALYTLLARINAYLLRWLRKKHKRLRGRRKAQDARNKAVRQRPRYFAHRARVT